MSDKVLTRQEKGRRIMLIVILADIVLLAAGILIFILLMKGDTPEDLAKRDLDAAYSKDWKTIVYQTPDDVLKLLLSVDADIVKKKEITTEDELRIWALDHAAEVADQVKEVVTLDNDSIEKVNNMPSEKYIEDYLGGEGDNEYYLFLRRKEEIAVVEISYIMVDGDREVDRKDKVIMYKKDGDWYSLTGLQVIDSMLRSL